MNFAQVFANEPFKNTPPELENQIKKYNGTYPTEMTKINNIIELPTDITQNINGFVFKTRLDWIQERVKFLDERVFQI